MCLYICEQKITPVLQVRRRVEFKIATLRDLADDVTPAIEVASRHRLRSANRHRLIVPPCRLNTYTAVSGLFRSLVRRSGTHCQMNSEIHRVMSTASNSYLKQSCSALTSVTSALEVIFNVMRSINPRFTYFTYLLTLVFKALNGLAPPYLVNDCNLVSDDIRRLRSAVSFTCAVPRTRLGDRSFAVAGPRVWNCLAAALRAVEDYERFKKLLKHICSIRLRRLVTFCF